MGFGNNPISSLEELKKQMEQGQEIQVDQEGKLHIPNDQEVQQQLTEGKKVSKVKPQRWF
jgi:cell fate (sporulation/competence/biofilm development) regulator YlbF (YheA/YmcA/DUF963 family)